MSLKNGHAPAKTLSMTAGARRMRRFRDRKAKGIVVIPDIEVASAAIDILIAGGRLHPSQRQNREAVKLALSAICARVLSSGVRNSDLPIVEADVKALQAAVAWVRPGTQPSMQSVGKALSTVAKCSALAGFTPREFGERLKVMAGIN